MRYILLLLACILTLPVLSNNPYELEDLLNFRNSKINDSIRVEKLIDIAGMYRSMQKYDSALYVYSNVLSNIEDKSFANAQATKAKVLKSIGNIHFSRDNYTKAIESYDISQEIYHSAGDIKGEAYCLLNKGLIRKNQGDYGVALSYFIKALELSESISDNVGIGTCNNAIGVVHMYQRRFERAIESYLRAVEYFQKVGDVKRIAEINNNIGAVYASQGVHEKALQYYSLALSSYEELDDYNGIALACLNAGISCSKIGNYILAVEFCEKSIQISQQLGYEKSLAGAYNCMSYISKNRADVTILRGKGNGVGHLNEAVEWGEKAYGIATKLDILNEQQKAALNLKEAYSSLGNNEEALRYADVIIELSDSVFTIANVNAVLEMTTRYETEKKELMISQMEKEQQVNALLISRQKVVIIFSIVVLIISLIFSWVIYRLFSEKRIANNELLERNEEINQQKEEIESQRNELEEQRDFVVSQKEEIDSSIRYAKRIQTALLPSDNYINQYLNESFLVFKPKDIVSGDFYWVRKVNDYLVIAVADSTGHGVPGALMSMLGVSNLNEIVAKEEEVNAASILNKLRSYVIQSLKQTSEVGAQKDGMDMSIISINTKTFECSWAGANLPIWIIRSSKLVDQDSVNSSVVEVIKGDKMPVSVHMKMQKFTNNIIQLERGDSIYLFTDGYYHQFGGDKGKSYMYKPFMKLIGSCSLCPMKEQGEKIENKLQEWMTHKGRVYDQIDDITVLGVKL